MLTTDQIRQLYLDYFKKKAHPVIASDSLVPHNDPSLLFTGAGMNQFKDYFLGVKKDLKRATSSQKCLRTGDLEEVGRTPYHHSFFEMLGNFSFGDYFKEGAIEMAWEFLTKELKMDPKRLRISVHHSDNEAFEIWSQKISIRKDWIYKLGDKDNFWPANAPTDGPNGPCGPCSEIYYDQNPSLGEGGDLEQTFEDEGRKVKRFAEIWNLVFTQFDRQDGGKLVPLAQKNIDTGMGLERLACMLQNKKTNYETDALRQINEAVMRELRIKQTPENAQKIYAITDHARGVIFAIADGVIPSNEGRGYVIRKLIRRALWHATRLVPDGHLKGPFLYDLVEDVAKVMAKPYPEIGEAKASIRNTIKGEEERFLETLENGLNILSSRLKSVSGKTLTGEIVFELYDTYGFPVELTRVIAEEKGLSIDEKGFDRLMEEQRKRAKDSTKIASAIFATTDLDKKVQEFPATQFLGYSAWEGEAKVLWAEIKDGQGLLIVDKTPFYAESGGQVGDQGCVEGPSFKAIVTDTQQKDKRFVHTLRVETGSLKAGNQVKLSIDSQRRASIMRNHTATHLLHAALRKILGPQVRQLGSLVAPDRLRFDFSYGQALTSEQLRQIEDDVNSEILKNTALTKEEKPIEQAKQEGAIAFFGEKYGASVRVVSVPGYSKEFCGGTHCDSTGQIGLFVIASDSSVASGTRRLEALTGEGALEYVRTLRSQIREVSQALKTTPDKLGERVAKLQENLKKAEKGQAAGAGASERILSCEKSVGDLKFLGSSYKNLNLDGLRKQSDDLRSKSTKTVYFIGAENDDKIHFLVGLSHDLAKSGLDVRGLAKNICSLLKGSGGGRPDLVQGGAPNEGQLAPKWDDLGREASNYLKDKVS